MNHQHNFSSVRGKIRYLLLAFNSRKIALPMERFKVLQHLMPGVKFVLWCSREDVGAAVQDWLSQQGITHARQLFNAPVVEPVSCLVVYEPFSDINAWIRDAFWPSWVSGGQCYLLDTVDEDSGDQGWAKRLTQLQIGTDLRFKILGNSDDQLKNLGIAGGNVLADGDWLFLGKPAPVLEAVYRTHVNRRVRVITLTEQKGQDLLYHLDLFLTLTAQESEGRYVVLLGKCMPLSEEYQTKATAVNQVLDRIARRLEQDFGLKVIRNPLPLGDQFFSYNNCIAEVSGAEKNVWLPAYTFDFSDINELQGYEAENRQIWQNLGFNPRMIEASFQDLYGVKAGLHCITNEVRSS